MVRSWQRDFYVVVGYSQIYKHKITSDETGFFSAQLMKQKYSDDFKADEKNNDFVFLFL